MITKGGAGTGSHGVAEEGPGFPFFYPKGMVVRTELEEFLAL